MPNISKLSSVVELEQLRDRKVLAFCAIARPDSFERTLSQAGVRLCAERRYGDHHRYCQGELDELAELGRDSGCSLAVTTTKDLVKIQYDELIWGQQDTCPLWAVDIEMIFSEQTRELLRDKLEDLFAGKSSDGAL